MKSYTSTQLLIMVPLSLILRTYVVVADYCTLLHLNNAAIEPAKSSYDVGEKVTYACKTGYFMHNKTQYVDKLQRTCLGFGKWDGSFLSCDHYDVFRDKVNLTNLSVLRRPSDEGENACFLLDLKHNAKLSVNISKRAYEILHIVIQLESQNKMLDAISLSVFLELEKRRSETAYECTYDNNPSVVPFSVQLPADVRVTCKLTGHTSALRYSTIAEFRFQAPKEAKHTLLSVCSLKGLVYHAECDSKNIANGYGDATSNLPTRTCSSYEMLSNKCGKPPTVQNGSLREIQKGIAILECEEGFFPRPEKKDAFCNEFTSWHWTWNVSTRGSHCIPIHIKLSANKMHTSIVISGSNESEKRENISTLLDLSFSISWYYTVLALSLLALLFCVGCTSLYSHMANNKAEEFRNVFLESGRCKSFIEGHRIPSTSVSNMNHEIDSNQRGTTLHLHSACQDADGYEIPI